MNDERPDVVPDERLVSEPESEAVADLADGPNAEAGDGSAPETEERPFIEDDNEPLAMNPFDVDDQFRALMAGLRTTIPGVLTLFAFLLVLPLQSNFESLSDATRAVFLVGFTMSAVSALLLVAPSVHQRVRAPRSGIRRRSFAHVMVAVRMAIVGTFTFAISILCVVYLITSFMLNETWAVMLTTALGFLAAWAWFYLPLVDFQRTNRPPTAPATTQRPPQRNGPS